MSEILRELLDSVHSAGACMADIRELAGSLSQLSAEQIEQFLLNFVDEGEDRALSRLLQACAFNEVQLDPTVLCRCIGVCEEMPDSAPCFALQDGSAIPPLLAASVAEELSVKRKNSPALSMESTLAQRAGHDEEAAIIEPSGKPTLPEYADAFRKTCEFLPPKIVAKAILATGRFAAHDYAIWRQTKPIKRLPDHYRIVSVSITA
jgi:hypothetical protein